MSMALFLPRSISFDPLVIDGDNSDFLETLDIAGFNSADAGISPFCDRPQLACERLLGQISAPIGSQVNPAADRNTGIPRNPNRRISGVCCVQNRPIWI